MQLAWSPRLRSWVLPLGLAVLIAAIVSAAMLIGRGGNSRPIGAHSSGTPPTLHLSSYQSGGATAAAAGAPEPAVHPGASQFELVGTLPDGQPADQSVWRPKHADAADASTVAAALGLSGAPTRITGGWVLRNDNNNRLVVRDDGSWSYGLDCAPEQPIANEDATVGCAVASSGVAVAAPPPALTPNSSSVSAEPTTAPVPAPAAGPSETDARAAAAKVFDKLGLGDATTSYYEGSPTAQVVANPKVHGLDVVGWSTSLSVSRDGSIAAGDGWLTGLTEGDAYPVITAQKAYELLQAQPRPAIEMCVRRSDGKPGCAPIPPTRITGAHLGLMLDYDAASAVLVPAWLFDVKDSTEPLTQIAVDPSFLAPPNVGPGAPGYDPSGNGSSGSGGGVAPAPGRPGAAMPTKPPAGGPVEPIGAPGTPNNK